MVNFTVRYLGSRGREVEHLSGCDCTASTVPQFFRDDIELTPALDERACTEEDIRVCSEECAAWGIETPSERVCVP